MAENPHLMAQAEGPADKLQGSGKSRGLHHRWPVDLSLKLGPQIVPPLSLQPGTNVQLARQLTAWGNQTSLNGFRPEDALVTGEGVVQIDADTERESLFQNRASAETIRSTEIP